MWSYSLKRLLGAIPTLFVVMTISFFMMRLAPGGPFDRERMLSPAVEENIQRAYDLDKPLVAQYGIYLWKALHGDLGPSFKYQDYTVVELIASGFPVSFKIGLTAIILALGCVGVADKTAAALPPTVTEIELLVPRLEPLMVARSPGASLVSPAAESTTEVMAGVCLEVASCPEPLAELLASYTEGLPFLVEELLAGWIGTGALMHRAGGWTAKFHVGRQRDGNGRRHPSTLLRGLL